MVPFHVVIPARYGSMRLPGKPLLEIGDRPMIQHVVERASASRADRVLVATDDARIAAAVHDPRGSAQALAILTDSALQSGTDRVAAVAEQCGWTDETIVVRLEALLATMSLRDAARAVAEEMNVARSRVYHLGLALKQNGEK